MVTAALPRAPACPGRVVERYPRNTKLLKAYARFLEDVQHDPVRANRYYSEADKNRSSDSNNNLAVLAKSMEEFQGAPGSELDERTTAIIVINAGGIIMALNHVRGGAEGESKFANQMPGAHSRDRAAFSCAGMPPCPLCLPPGSQFAFTLFGYTRAEMEGHDIAMLVPPPYNQRHHTYLQRYITTEQPHIVGQGRRQVIGMHKASGVLCNDVAL